MIVEPAPSPLPPLQERTPTQLTDGMHIAVTGAQSTEDGIALARLMQDAADWVATQEHTTPSLAQVRLHDPWGDRLGKSPFRWLGKLPVVGSVFGAYQAMSDFGKDGRGTFKMAGSQSVALENGIERLRTTPMDEWTPQQRADFTEANATILHELSHLTLKSYTPAQIKAWNNDDTGIEEGLAELISVEEMPDFMRYEYGVTMSPLDETLQQTASVYTAYTTRMKRLFTLAGDTDHDDLLSAARTVAAGVDVNDRSQAIADMIAHTVAPNGANPADVSALAKLIPAYVEEGSSIGLMDAVAKLAGDGVQSATDAPAPAADTPASANNTPQS